MKNILLIIFTGIVLNACKKTDSDFVGTYQTFYSAPIILGELQDPFLRRFQRTAQIRQYKGLCEIKVEIFIDEGKKNIAGNASLTLKQGKYTELDVNKFDFELKDIRIKDDTLIFMLDNPKFERAGSKVTMSIFKNGKNSVIGFEYSANSWVSSPKFGYRMKLPTLMRLVFAVTKN